jgi:hypothetical protein
LDYFRPFGPKAINDFGYTTLVNSSNVSRQKIRRPILVVNEGQRNDTDLPSVELTKNFEYDCKLRMLSYIANGGK